MSHVCKSVGPVTVQVSHLVFPSKQSWQLSIGIGKRFSSTHTLWKYKL